MRDKTIYTKFTAKEIHKRTWHLRKNAQKLDFLTEERAAVLRIETDSIRYVEAQSRGFFQKKPGADKLCPRRASQSAVRSGWACAASCSINLSRAAVNCAMLLAALRTAGQPARRRCYYSLIVKQLQMSRKAGQQPRRACHSSSPCSATRATETTTSPLPVLNTLTPPAERERNDI
jgi:hypothetical protein